MLMIEDIKRLNYIYYSSFRQFSKSPQSLIMCYLRFFIRTLKSVVLLQVGYTHVNEVLFVVPSVNNKKSVRTIVDNFPQKNVSIWGNFKMNLPWALINLYSILDVCKFQKFYNSSSSEDKKLIRRFFSSFINTYGYYKVFKKILEDNPQLKMIVFSNDHTTPCRCLIELAEKLQIKTLYVQHASVTERFPPLRFDYSFLDGMESYEKYRKIGNLRGEVFLSGSPRFDAFYNQCKSQCYDVGIALNMMDSIEKVLELCLYLRDHYSKKIIVRPHPGMLNGRFDERIFLNHGISISDSRKDMSNVFISQIYFLIANESGIHLDAAIMGVPSVLFNFSDNDIFDWYSYIKTGLVKVCSSYDDVLSLLNSNCHQSPEAVRYYAASFHSPMDGKVGEMIATFMKKEIFNSSEDSHRYIYNIMSDRGGYAEYNFNKLFLNNGE